MGVLGTIATLVTAALVVAILYSIITVLPNSPFSLPSILNLSDLSKTIPQNLSYTTVATSTIVPQNQSIAYALSVVNQNRTDHGLTTVSLSNETSGQQHADSMLQYGYFSHWDLYGMKPYMRYTLSGGVGAVDENVAFIYRSNGINVLQSIAQMEYSMMDNDSVCCMNGHRYNILNGNHTQISLGVAYNATTIYLVEDFINNYVSWVQGTPSYNSGAFTLKGVIPNGYSLASIDITFDPPVMNLTPSTVPKTPYSYGTTVACVGHTAGLVRYLCTDTQTVNATAYTTQGQSFDVEFNIDQLISKYGAGEYTYLLWLNNTSNGQKFIAATYTVFIDANGNRYIPNYV